MSPSFSISALSSRRLREFDCGLFSCNELSFHRRRKNTRAAVGVFNYIHINGTLFARDVYIVRRILYVRYRSCQFELLLLVTWGLFCSLELKTVKLPRQ